MTRHRGFINMSTFLASLVGAIVLLIFIPVIVTVGTGSNLSSWLAQGAGFGYSAFADPTGSLVPAENGTYDIGDNSTPRRWRDLWLSRNADIDGALDVAGTTTLQSATTILDDALLSLGTGTDQVFINRSTLLSADAELAGVIVGTSNHQGAAANSLVLSNITASGDVLGLVNQGGHSLEWLNVDASAGKITIGHGLQSNGGKLTFNPSLDGNITNTLTFESGSTGQNASVLVLRHLSGEFSSAWFGCGKAGGTDTSPSVTLNTYRVCELTGLGWDGTNWRGLGQYGVLAVGDTSATNRGGKLYFETRYQNDPDDVTAWRQWMTLGHNGQLLLDMTATPPSATPVNPPLIIQSSTNALNQIKVASSTATVTGGLFLIHHNGTIASPTATLDTYTLGQVVFGGYTNAITGASKIQGVATENWGATAKGAKLEFYTTGNTTLVQDLRMTIDQNGDIIVPDLAAPAGQTCDVYTDQNGLLGIRNCA